jgi:hypothetical protein
MTSHISDLLQISIKTNLPTVDKAVAVMADATFTETHSWFEQFISRAPKGKLYEGYVHPNGFRIKHINIHRKISPTSLDGNFILTPHGVDIKIHCRLLQPSLIGWILYFLGIMALLVVISYITTRIFWMPPADFILAMLIVPTVMIYFYAKTELNLAKRTMNWLFKEKPIPTLPAIKIAKPTQHLALTLTLPIDPPIAAWKIIPIMPNAIAGEETISNYRYITKASSEEVKDYYIKTLQEYGWLNKQAKPAASFNKYISVLPNEKNGYIIYLGNTFDFIYIYTENELTHVDIILTT